MNILWEMEKVADISDPEFWKAIVGAETAGATLPYRLRFTVQLGVIEEVLLTALPVKLGEAVLLVVELPEEAPVREATSWFWA